MTAALVWVALAGFWAGFAFRDRAYKRAARIPAPKSHNEVLGERIQLAIVELESGHKFAGDNVEVIHEATLERAGREYRMTIQRKAKVNA